MRRSTGRPRRLAELTPSKQRRAGAVMIARCLYSLTVIVGLYYVLPIKGHSFDDAAVLRLVIGAVLFGLVMHSQVRRIARADLPELRAVESVVVAVALFLCVYASVYLTLSRLRPANFSEQLDRTSSLYFTVTTFGTVGFGDIVPKTDASQLVVSSQILWDVVFIAVIARLLFGASRRSLSRRSDAAGPDPED